jgi:hypothetical protein
VVDLAVGGGSVAEGVVTLPVAHLDRAARRPGEQPPAHAHTHDAVGTVEHHPLHPGLIQQRSRDPVVMTVPCASSQTRTAKVS